MDACFRIYEELSSKARKTSSFSTYVDIASILLPIFVSVFVGVILNWFWRPYLGPLWAVPTRNQTRLASAFLLALGRRVWVSIRTLAASPAAQQIRLRIHPYMLLIIATIWGHFRGWFNLPRNEGVNGVGPVDRSALWVRFLGWFSFSHFSEARMRDAAPIAASREMHVDSPDDFVGVRDLENFLDKLEEVDSGPPWDQLMHKKTDSMEYRAWKRDTECGLTEYRSSTILEDVSAEVIRDFYWDDEYRVQSRWDELIRKVQVVEDYPSSGVQVVRWTRKLPFLYKEREYAIGRRIWSHGGSYYCITKTIHHPSVPPNSSSFQVTNYNSCWRIKPDPRGSCEVALLHFEDVGINKDLAKLAIRQGMWGAVKKMERGIRHYQIQRNSQATFSKTALFASNNTLVSPTDQALRPIWERMSNSPHNEVTLRKASSIEKERKHGLGAVLFVAGGVVAVSCGVKKSVLCKVFSIGLAAKMGVMLLSAKADDKNRDSTTA